MRGIGLRGRHHFRINQLALARDRNGYPFFQRAVVAYRDQVKTARSKAFSEKHFRNVAHRHNPAAPQDYAFQFRCAVRKAKNTAGGNELSNLVGRNGEAPFAQP
jgi:hypothetical protein